MDYLKAVVVLGVGLAAGAAALHALLNKRDSKSALGWIAVCVMFPLAGPLAYFLFGFNRVRTRARKLRGGPAEVLPPGSSASSEPELPEQLRELVRISSAVTRRRLLGGNSIEPLWGGDAAFPPMLDAIGAARQTVYLSTYIFSTDETGRRFLYELGAAARRGVEVRVLVDGVGALYSWPRAVGALRRLGVRSARFLPPSIFPPTFHINLRNHRKILTVDGEVAFTGGMNLGDVHLEGEGARSATDAHFRVTGPAVGQLESVFCEDWRFVTGEQLRPNSIERGRAGQAVCRTVVDGPNEDFDKLLQILVAAVSAARRRVEIMTPYFLPPRELAAALEAAALRGVEVNVLLPAKNNLPYVHWASRNGLAELLERGVRIFYQPPPFVHTKLFAVDDQYVQIGSANLDPRSLRLNFEIAVEVYDQEFATAIRERFLRARSAARRVTLEEIEGRALLVRVRDALAWLFSPYL